MSKTRIAVAALSLSAAAFVGLWNQEGWTDTAIIPVKGDVPTVGPGLTKRADGSPVQIGDRIKPIDGANRSLKHVQQDESGIKKCLATPLSQVEYDLMVDFAYQYGVPSLCRSSIVRHANAGRYVESCNAYLLYRFVDGYDCSTMINGQRNRRCWGVWERSKNRHDACLADQAEL